MIEETVLDHQHSNFGVIAMALGGFYHMYKEDLYILHNILLSKAFRIS